MTQHTPHQIDRLIDAIEGLVRNARSLERKLADDIEQIEPGYRDSARNLVHYLAVRQHDLRDLQEQLSELGLSSLGRLEAHTMAALHAVLGTLRRLAGSIEEMRADRVDVGFRTGPLLLKDHAERLLGDEPRRRDVRIMVTMPSEAATDPNIIARLLSAGMNLMRINCAHDDPVAWQAMLDHLETAKRDLGVSCRVLADLAGPKLRTGGLPPGPCVAKIRPQRDDFGRVSRAAWIWITPAAAPEKPDTTVDRVLSVEGPMQHVAPDAQLRLVDTRGRRRRLRVVRIAGASALVESDRTLYVDNGTEIRITGSAEAATLGVVGIPPLPSALELKAGDRLMVVRPSDANSPAEPDALRISCSLPEAFEAAREGEPIWFDDGKIGGRIDANEGDRLVVTITSVPPRGAKLRAGKGINLPETDLQINAVSARDLECLASLAPRIDMVGLSFVRAPEDVVSLQRHLHAINQHRLGIVLKIENRLAFERLPRILLAGMRSPPFGVMVARGDLGVEVGYERLAEIQEEILWMCEAAHTPVIWATQVLEELATKGAPTRAEVTDAAMSGRAECVMLNKGPYIVDAVEFLSGVLERMESHQSKKSARLRRLHVSQAL